MLPIILIPSVLLLLLLFLVFPAPRRHDAREHLRGKYIAHRGLHGSGIAENSLDAFQAAAERGYIIENDIHLTADGEVVVFHDDTLKRMCGENAKVEDKTLAELKALRLGETAARIPTLRDCLDIVNGRVPLLIEFKVVNGNTAALCEAADKILADYKGEYFVQSFYPQVLLWYRCHRKEICRGQLAEPFKGEALHRRMLGAMLFNFLARPDFVAYEHTAATNVMRRIITVLGAHPVCWTLRSQSDLDAARKHFETYIFENFIPR